MCCGKSHKESTPPCRQCGGLVCEVRTRRKALFVRAQVGGNFLSGVATDESDPDAAVDALSAKMGPQMTEGMIGPYRKMLERVK